MKKCPFCAEEIQDAAIRCRYCHSDLPREPKTLPLTAAPFCPQPDPWKGDRSLPAGAPAKAPRQPKPSPAISIPQIVMVALLAVAFCAVSYRFFRAAFRSRGEGARITGVGPLDTDGSSRPLGGLSSARTDELMQADPARLPPAEVARHFVTPVSDEDKRSSQQYYLAGLVFFQKGDFAKARQAWATAVERDPANEDAVAGMERIKKLYEGQ